ncbi:MAG: multiheme c-type cytochrome [Acidobacteriota bacterium]
MIRRFLLLLTVALAAAGADRRLADQGSVVALVESYYGPGAAASRIYVGAEVCLACHPAQAGWRRSLHATGLKMVPNDAFSMKVKDGVVADANRNGVDDFKDGLDFNKISSAFDRYKPNAPIMKYDAAKGYSIQIGEVVFPVIFAHGGTGQYKQRWVVRIPVVDRPDRLSAGVYESPIQFNEANSQYAAYNPQNWYNADNTPIFTSSSTAKDTAKSNSFDKKCAGCHSTSMSVVKDANGEYVATAPPALLYFDDDLHYLDLNGDGIREQFNIGCERCHGPGGQHVLARGDKTKIINPAKDLTAKQANDLCGSCHSRGVSKPEGVHEYPWDETTKQEYQIGEELYGRFWQDRPGLWPDGVEPRQHHQQLEDLMRSSKWGTPHPKVTCWECHDVHLDTYKLMRRVITTETASGAKININAKVQDNSLCLACHAASGPFARIRKEDVQNLKANQAAIAAIVSEHSKHSYDPERALGLGRCTECHMAKVAVTGVAYDISTHTFSAIPPEKTLATQAQGGMPNACAVRCHRPLAPIFGLPADANLATWNEPSDVELAKWLQKYYGPEGLWWKTKK